MRALSVAAIAIGCALPVGCGPAEPPASSSSTQEPAVSPLSVSDTAFPSNELLAIQRYLEAQGKSWRFFYDSVDGKLYQWLITRSVTDSGVHYHFAVGREIDESGRIIGGLCLVSDQFFSLRLDRTTSKVEEMYGIGG